MISARYNEEGSIILDVNLIGRCSKKKVQALLDTGFSGAIALPTAIGCEIGLESVGDASVVVASGETVAVPIFIGTVEIGDDRVECIFIILSGSDEVLLGMEVIRDYSVAFNASKKAVAINKAEELKLIEETMIEPTPMPATEVVVLPPEAIPTPMTEVGRMRTLKDTLREVVPR